MKTKQTNRADDLHIKIIGKFASGKTTIALEVVDTLRKLGFNVIYNNTDDMPSRLIRKNKIGISRLNAMKTRLKSITVEEIIT